MRSLSTLLLTAIMACGAAPLALAADLHEGEQVAVNGLPFCKTLNDAEAIAAYAKANGSGDDKYQELDGCTSGSGVVTLGKQLDSFPDTKSTDGTRYIVEFTVNGNETLYGLFSHPVLPPIQPSSVGVGI